MASAEANRKTMPDTLSCCYGYNLKDEEHEDKMKDEMDEEYEDEMDEHKHERMFIFMLENDEIYWPRAQTMLTAILEAVDMWKNGDLNVGKPQRQELFQCQKYLNKYLKSMYYATVDPEQVRLALSFLIMNDIGKHFISVQLHRLWVNCTYEILKISKVSFFNKDIEEQILLHDLSRYGPIESIAYIKICEQMGHYLTEEDEQKIREISIHRHNKINTHHPQYYGKNPMSTGELEQSMIDVIACRLKRDLNDSESLDADMIPNIPPSYLMMYTTSDQRKVQETIDYWGIHLNELMNNPTKQQVTSLQDWLKKYEDILKYTKELSKASSLQQKDLVDCTDMLYEDEIIMCNALLKAVYMWRNREFSVKGPTMEELDCCLKYLQGLSCEQISWSDEKNEMMRSDLGSLCAYNIGKHFDMVASHRKWIKLAYELIKMSEVLFYHEDMDTRIHIHDLSKFGPREALGYSIMFGDRGQYRTLEGDELKIWEQALHHHYKNNTHHPQYYGQNQMQTADIEESVLDMLACRLERDLKEFETLDANTILNIPPNYLLRYHTSDQCKVNNTIAHWLIHLNRLFNNHTDQQGLALQEWMAKSGYKLKLEKKTDIPLFNVPQLQPLPNSEMSMYMALLKAVEMWKNGELNVIAPSVEELDSCLSYLKNPTTQGTMKYGNEGDNIDEMIRLDLSFLIMGNIGKHFHLVADHREWLKCMYELLTIAGVIFQDENMDKRICIHDLSRYHPIEVIAHTIMMGDTILGSIQDRDEQKICEKALSHHYKNNSYHKQYHESGLLPIADLEESIIDMMACRLGNAFQCHLDAKRIMDFSSLYLRRYSQTDQDKVKHTINLWCTLLDKLINNPTKQQIFPLRDWMSKYGHKIKHAKELDIVISVILLQNKEESVSSGADILDESEIIMRSALVNAIHMWDITGWGRGLGVESPTTKELDCCLNYLENLPPRDQTLLESDDDRWILDMEDLIIRDYDRQSDLNDLLYWDVGDHFDNVARHRKWVQLTYELLKIARVSFHNNDMENRVCVHDLSFYGPREALGYSMLATKSGYYRSFNSHDKEICEEALLYHHRNNTHHPHYYGNNSMPDGDLQESIIDLMAHRLERDLEGEYLDADEIMTFSTIYLMRYNPSDQDNLKTTIDYWRLHLHQLFNNTTKHQADLLQDWMNRTGYKVKLVKR